MSASSTVSNSYVNNNSWLQPKGHGLSSSSTSSSSCSQQQQQISSLKSSKKTSDTTKNNTNTNTNNYNYNKGMTLPNGSRRPSKVQPQQLQQPQQQQQQQDGFARSTASSRSRSGNTTDDLGVSQIAINEAFALAEKQLDTNNKQHHLATNPRRPSTLHSDLRRKSLAETSTRRRLSRVGDSSTATTTGTTPPTPSAAGMLSPPQRTRAHSLAVVSNTRRRSTTTTTTNTNQSHRKPAPPPSLLNPQYDDHRGKISSGITTTSLRASSMNRPSNRSSTATTTTKKSSPSSPCLGQTGSNTTCSSITDQPSCRSSPPRDDKSLDGSNHHQPPTQPDSLAIPLDRQEPGLIRLVDALRDSLAVERQKAKRELAMHMDTKTNTTSGMNENINKKDDARPTQKLSPRQLPIITTTAATTITNKKHQQPPGASSADIIYNAKRRLTSHCIDTTTTAMSSSDNLDSPPKATATQSQLERRASLMAYVRQRSHPNDQQPPLPSTTTAGITSPDTPTRSTSLARLQQRGSLSSSHQLKLQPHLSQSSPRQSPAPQQRQRKKSLQPIVTTTNTCSSSSSASSASPSGASHGGATTKTVAAVAAATTSIRSRKKSIVGGSSATESSTAASTTPTSAAFNALRRRSRTESLKDGVPIASSSPRTTTTPTTPRSRKKSLGGTTQQQDGMATAAKSSNTTKKPMVPPPTYTRKRGKTLPGSLAKPPVIQPTAQLPPMKMEPIQIALPKQKQRQQQQRQHGPSRNGRNSSHHRSHVEDPGLESGGEETAARLKKKTPTSARAPRRSSTAATPNKKKTSPTGATHLISTSRRPSMPQLSTQSSSRKLSISVAKQGGWYTYSDHADTTTTTTPATTTTAATSVPNSPGLTATRAAAARKQAIQGRKNSLGNPATGSAAMVPDQDTTPSVDKDRTRAMSLHEKLQAMVAQHTLQNNTNNGDTDRRTRKSQNYDIDDKYYEHRLRSHRHSEPFLHGSDHPALAGDNVARSPQNALQLYGACLSSFERQEIQDYSDIYFVGPYAKKIPATATTSPPAPSSNNNNNGYDDERGDYLIIRQDHLAYRYEILEELGRGSFGQVVKCFDHKTNTSVAIKLIRNKRRFHEQALMEVKILKDLVTWDPDDGHHNVRMTDYFYFRNHLCIVCECLSINLYEFIKKYEYKGFAVSLIKRFAVQLLRSLCLLYDHDVIHCDLKPENILLKHPAKSTIKVIDFGSSCFTNEKMYTYIQSRFYRAPEIILGTTYNTAIDMWSFGCILAELYTGIPIFPGETEQEQLACIMEILGVPDDNLIHRCSRRKLFFDSNNRPRPVINSRGKQRIAGAKSLAGVLRCQQEPLFLDFIQCCLQWDPDLRLTPYDALQHPWFTTSTSKTHPPPASVTASPAALTALPT